MTSLVAEDTLQEVHFTSQSAKESVLSDTDIPKKEISNTVVVTSSQHVNELDTPSDSKITPYSPRSRLYRIPFLKYILAPRKRLNWHLKDGPLSMHPYLRTIALLINIGILIELLITSYLTTVQLTSVLATLVLYGMFLQSPDMGEHTTTRQVLRYNTNRLKSLPFKIPNRRDLGVSIAAAAVWMGAAISATQVREFLGTTDTQHELLQQLTATSQVESVFLVAAFAFAGVFEEIIVRHYLQKKALSSFTTNKRIWIAAAVFGLAHIFVYPPVTIGALVVIVTLIVNGAILGYSYELTDNLAVPSTIHAGNNALALTAILFF